MNGAGEKRNRRLWQMGLVAFLITLVFGPEVSRMMRPELTGPRADLPHIDCYAETVALHQQLHITYDRDPANGFDEWTRFNAIFENMQAWKRGLRRRDDPKLPQLRPAIAQAEAARDAAVAEDVNKYLKAAWFRVQKCGAELFGGKQASTGTNAANLSIVAKIKAYPAITGEMTPEVRT